MAVTHPPTGRQRSVGRTQSGARSGAVLAGASAISIVANYVFLLAAGRVLGSAGYGSLAALLGLIAVVVLPASALQMAVAREISRRVASADERSADALARSTLRVSLIATAPLLAIALALAVPLSDLLHIHNTGVVLLAETSLVTAFVFPVALGILQGFQRFYALGAMYLVPLVLRLVVFGIAAAAGARLGGAIFAATAGSIGGTVAAIALIREPLRRGRRAVAELRPFFRYLTPVAAGLIGIALLTHIDILVVKARLSADAAGAYAAASAFARVGFFLPATIVAVLFPRTAARQARGEQTEDILGRSLLATAVFCALLAVFYAATGRGIVTLTFGHGFGAGGSVLAPFALAIGLYSLTYILVGYHLSRGESRYAWIVAAGVLVQVVTLSLVPGTLHSIVWANLAIAATLVASHEVFVGSSVPALRAGWLHASAATRARIRRVSLESGLVLLGTAVFVGALFWPVVEHLSSAVIGSPGSDSTGSVAFFWTLQHESGYHLLGTTHHTLSGAPIGWDEGNGLNVQWLLPYYPTYLATELFGAVAAYNLITLAGYVLSGASMYLLTRYLGCARAVAVWATVVFVIFPWHFARAEHASLTHIEVLALLVLALVAAARRPTLLRFGFVGLATLACWLTSGYFGGIAVVTVIAFAIGAALVSPALRALVLIAGSTAAALVASGLVAMAAYLSGTNAGAGIHRQAGDLTYYGLRPLELVVPSARHVFFGSGLDSFWLRHDHGSNVTEISNYLGLLTFALAIVWVVVAIRRRVALRETGLVSATAGLVAAFVVGFLFSLPSPVLGISMPSKLLWDLVPAFRVPSRWDPLLMTTLLALAALGLQTIYRTASARRIAAGLVVVCAAIAISVVELATHRVNHFRTVPVPAEYTALKSSTPNGVVAEYPLGYSDIYRLWQRVHGRPLVNGAPADTTADQAHLMLLDPAQPGTAQSLSLLGVTAIVVHPGGHADVPVEPHVPKPADGYRLIGRYADGSSVWDVVAPAAPAFVTLPGGFLQPQATAQGVVYPFAAASGVGLLELRATTPGVVRLVFDATPPKGSTTRDLRIEDAQGEQKFALHGVTHFELNVEVPRGVSQLILKTDPPATSATDAVLISQPRTEQTTASATLHARPTAPDPGF